MDLSKTHRTAVFVRIGPDDSDEYVERREALVKSLNRPPNVVDGGTIKANIYSVVGSQVVPGLQDVAEGPVEPPASLVEQAEAAGFTLVRDEDAVSDGVQHDGGRGSSANLRNAARGAGYVRVV